MITIKTIQQALKASGSSSEVAMLNPEQTFTDSGFDSLDMFNLFVELEQMTGHLVPDNKIDELTTPQSIINYFNSLS